MHRRFVLLLALVLLVVGSLARGAAAQPLEPAAQPVEPVSQPQEPEAQPLEPNATTFRVYLPLVIRSRITGIGTVTGTPTDDEMDVIKLINDYRQQKGLSRVRISRSLMLVAQTHVKDLVENRPDTSPCNLHSWSNKGKWSSVCYTGSSTDFDAMWNKPREITSGGYPGNGFEIAYWTSATATPSVAVNAWKGSPDHNDVILQQGAWGGMSSWPAIGAGMYKGYAVVWFGDTADPLGTVAER